MITNKKGLLGTEKIDALASVQVYPSSAWGGHSGSGFNWIQETLLGFPRAKEARRSSAPRDRNEFKPALPGIFENVRNSMQCCCQAYQKISQRYFEH
ncbi:hypothetical protein TNCV_1179381 [Trichonephila clavipes]|nr:hypothetical protein TNCV_1179381 [Trichonephila clavipes]